MKLKIIFVQQLQPFRYLFNLYQFLGNVIRRQTDDIIFQKIGHGISCKLSPMEIISMKCQSLFSGGIRNIFQFVVHWTFYPGCKLLAGKGVDMRDGFPTMFRKGREGEVRGGGGVGATFVGFICFCCTVSLLKKRSILKGKNSLRTGENSWHRAVFIFLFLCLILPILVHVSWKINSA